MAGIDRTADDEVFGSRVLCLAHLGPTEEAFAALDEGFSRLDIDGEQDEAGTSFLAKLLEAAVLLVHLPAAALLSKRLAGVAHLAVCEWNLTSIARHLGGAAILLGDREQAWTYYEKALEVCTKIGFRPEIALIRLQMAELCLEEVTSPPGPLSVDGEGVAAAGGEVRSLLQKALDYLDFCIPEFWEMKMQPSLERALRLRERLSV